MKKLTCEMCGSTEIIKEEGVFVCQNCGTKYSVEEAKKMMVEGTVDVSGSTVKIDNSDKLDNFYIMAENAYNADNKKEAEEYCNKIIENDSQNYKAWFLKGKSAGWQSTLAKLRFDEAVSAFKNAIDNAPEDKKENLKKEAGDEINSLCLALITLACNNYSKYGSETEAEEIISALITIKNIIFKFMQNCNYSTTDMNKEIANRINVAVVAGYKVMYNNYGGPSEHPSDYAFNRYATELKAGILLLETAIDLSEDDHEQDIQIYKNLIFLTKELESAKSYTYSAQSGGWITDKCWNVNYKKELIDKIMNYHQKISELDPNYVVPSRPQPSSGCYVATCVYGSYDCPQVWTLRRFRDYTLAKTWYGRAFIHTYYAISPTIIKWFGETNWFKKFWKGKLDTMVKQLQEKGFDNTPYEDIKW